jgi:iron(III) transport system ATP-binding protein
VFQDGALFPHISAADNIAFGLKAAGQRLGRAERRARVEELLEMIGLAEVGGRRPDTLSGGQPQRIALARSLAPNPSVLLLDEPFSALDAGLRIQVRSEVARILRELGLTSIFVTHDQDEAFALGDSVAVMRVGRIEQVAAPAQLYAAPANPWVAGFVGEANFAPGRRTGRRVETKMGTVRLADDAALPETEDVLVLIRPEQVALSDGDAATVTDMEYYGHDVRYELRLDDGTSVVARAHPGELRARGDRVAVSFESSVFTTVFPAHSEARI